MVRVGVRVKEEESQESLSQTAMRRRCEVVDPEGRVEVTLGESLMRAGKC